MNHQVDNGNAGANKTFAPSLNCPARKSPRQKVQPFELLSSDFALLGMASVIEFTGFSRATIYRYIKEGKFPAPCKIGQWASRWKAGEVRAWLEAQKGGAQ